VLFAWSRPRPVLRSDASGRAAPVGHIDRNVNGAVCCVAVSVIAAATASAGMPVDERTGRVAVRPAPIIPPATRVSKARAGTIGV